MASIFTFESSRIEALLHQYGIRQAWVNILATRIKHSSPSFKYILETSIFRGATTLDSDLLDGLSIGEVGVLYEYSVAYVDQASRKDNGQYFTPDDISKFMVKEALSFPEGVWLDPCSGIGNLSWHLVNSQTDKEEFLANRMVLSDKDELALAIARVLFTLSFQSKRENLYNEIENSFVVLDFLSVAESRESTLFGSSSLNSIPSHDFVLVNPPYLGLKQEDKRFETSKCKDLYAYFLENIIKTSAGFVAVTPQSFTNAGKFRSLRALMLRNFSFLKIYAFDNIPGNVFYGVKFGSTNSNVANSMRASITVASKVGKGHQITSLLRWRTSERKALLSKANLFLSTPGFSEEFFPKVSSCLSDLYMGTKSLPRFEALLSNTQTPHALFIPSAPRYFISALKKAVSRSSMKTLYFRTESDMNVAYLLLNSSFMYWWWRVRDGGMTLSLETICSLPLPSFETDKTLIDALERSERENVVYKKNAGAMHENVKHDLRLVSQLNALVMPEFCERLILTHENSELVQLLSNA
jgi:hypothetical protein